jgi:hypothetical protein
MYLNAAGQKKLQDLEWLISAILAKFNHLRALRLQQLSRLEAGGPWLDALEAGSRAFRVHGCFSKTKENEVPKSNDQSKMAGSLNAASHRHRFTRRTA